MAVIVTGASRGVGLGIARHLAAQGVEVTITGRKADRLNAVATELEADGAKVLAVAADVADRDATFSIVEQTVARFGRVDGLVNNAQTFRPVTALEDVTAADLATLFDTGPAGTLWGMQAVFPHMRDQGFGRIVNLGSHAGLRGAHGYGPYAAAKEAIRALTRVAAREWARHGITVNCICPVAAGHREPPDDPIRRATYDAVYLHHPMDRDGDPEEDVAPVVAFLLSEGSRYLNGQTLLVDGGAYLMP